MTRYLLILSILLLSLSCKKSESKSEVDNELNELFAIMQGSYDSEIQSQVDSTYFNISLHMYPIWKDKGNFLYVEQALNSMQDKPYRQRIYEVTRLNDSTFKSAIYTLAVDSLWVGKWKTPSAFDSISLKDITLKDGCEVLLKRIEPNYFAGKTGKTSCESSLRGASYATSEVEILEDKIISWDRGFDSKGNHVWGAEKGGYIFNKLD
ncbi:chromophore lyase CpcT/CpeT [Aquaticitalea lipolytica]|uniref:chromophore lyase CpcT/CpeT n=1 Tax=Aquaticitalea lipolytica TaxID=1247562 RepID=UPI0024BA0F85|nr:chromophore lyase CpcT/CpeT [Aquaticitalea lipolytica]